MTALTMAPQPDQDTTPRPVPWRGMIWVTWRQHRATLVSVPAVLGVVAVFLLVMGLKIHHDYAVLTACHPFSSGPCQALNTSFNHTDWTIGNVLGILMLLVPVLLGAFAGAPVLGRELENGTFRYAWTQGFGRERFVLAKVVLLAVAITALAGAFSQLFTWFFRPFLAQEDLTVLNATVFASRGVVFAAWTLLAFSLGAFLGMAFRRIVPAMAVTLGVYLGLALAAWELRKLYPLALVTSNPSFGSGLLSARSPWILSTWYTGPGGRPASPAAVGQLLHTSQSSGPDSLPRLLAAHGLTMWTKYIPVSRFWPMQFVEAGWLLVLSVLLVAGTVLLVRRRAA
jgi:ABC-type transport system involved in multi-copper enzyme maturation permease subunit